MTREELDFIGGMNMCDEISNEAYRKICCHCEVNEPKTGHWMDDCGGVTCSCCGYHIDDYYYAKNYCTNCGVRMEVENGE